MEADELCLVWVGRLAGGGPPDWSVPGHVQQALCMPNHIAILTKEGRLGIKGKDEELVYLDDLADEADHSNSEDEEGCGGGENHLEKGCGVGRIQNICKGENEESILAVSQSGHIFKISLGQKVSVMREEVTLTDIAQIIYKDHHQIYLDSRCNVWSKGDVPYCGHVHSCSKYQKIPYLTGHVISQLQAGTNFTACVANPKNVVSPDSPDLPQDQVDCSLTKKESLFEQSSCPLGVKITSNSPVMKPGQKNSSKTSSFGSTSSLKSSSCDVSETKSSPNLANLVTSANDNLVTSTNENEDNGGEESVQVESSKHEYSNLKPSCQESTSTGENEAKKLIIRTESAVSALEADLDQPKPKGKTGDPEIRLSPCTSPSNENVPSTCSNFNQLGVDNTCSTPGRSSPVSLDDIRVNLTTKSSSEPPLSLTEHEATATRKRSSSLTLVMPKETAKPSLNPPPQSLVYNGKISDGGGRSVVGEDLWRGEVWAWGEGGRGQLGQGDMLPRSNPVPVQGIHNQFILKLSAGSQHVLMLTGAGRVYGWGHNTGGQANPGDKLGVVLAPSQIHLPRQEIPTDIQAVGNVSLILCHSGNIYFACQSSHSTKKQRLQCIELSQLGLSDRQPCSILAAWRGQDYVYLINSKLAVNSAANSRIAAAEKQLLDRIETVAALIHQLHSGSPAGNSNKNWETETPLGEVWRWLKKGRNLISESVYLYHTQQNQSQTTKLRGSFLIRQIETWIDICTELGYSIGNCVASDSLMLDSDQTQHHHSIVSILLHQFGWNQHHIKGQIELEQLMLELYNLNLPYIHVLEENLTNQATRQCIARLKCVQQTMDRQKKSCGETRNFWETNTDSRLDSYRKQDQRVVLDSRNLPVSLASAFSSHRFILLSDIFIDIGYNKISVHPLSTLWVDAVPGSSQGSKYSINLTMPEGSKTMVCTDLDTRNTWLKALTESVYRELCKSKKLITFAPQAPITRTVKYCFVRGDLRGCEYRGSMTQGRMQGKGMLTHPDSTVYTGGWRNDVKNGWGKLTLPNGTVKVGTWVEGKLTGKGRLKFPDGSEYEGDLVDGEPHGHGTMKSGRYVGDGPTVYIGSWSRGTRNGYGVLEDTSSGERYMGAWLEGLRQGHGCVVNSDGIYYEGTFTADKLTGPGIMIFEDGSIYEGEFCGAGEFYGSGTLTTRSEKFHGTFYGNYSSGMKFNGTVYRDFTVKNSDVPDYDFMSPDKIQRFTVSNSDKWKTIFEKFEVMLSEGGKTPWENLSVYFHQSKLAHLEADRGLKDTRKDMKRGQGFDSLETIPKVAKETELSWMSYCDIAEYLAAANTCPIHPVHQVISLIVNCFNASYGGLGSHPTLLPHAKDELKFVSWRLYSLFRILFPVLPAIQPGTQVWLPTPQQSDRPKNRRGEESCDFGVRDSVILTPDYLLFPLLLPSIYPALFNLYIQREDASDREYWARITRWNKHTDAALLTFFDVDTSAWELQIDRRSRDSVFLEAVYTLQRLKTTFTPADKLDVIVAVFKAITAGTDNFTWNMDLLLPVCMYIVVRARVLQLGAELHMVNDFMEQHLRQGMEGITFTTLQAAYTQIRRESVFIN